MKLLVENSELPLLGLAYYNDLNQLFSTIEFMTVVDITVPFVTLESDSKLKCRIIGFSYENGTFRYTAISEGTYNTLNFICESFTGKATVKKLLSSLGVKNSVDIQTNETFWVLPKTKLKYIIQYLNRYTSVQSGGAPRFFVNLTGELVCVDLKKVYDSTPKAKLFGKVISDRANMDWIIQFPGNVDVISYSKDGIIHKNARNGVGLGILRVNDTTGYATDTMIQRVSNEFSYNYYTSRKVLMEDTSFEEFTLGALVDIKGEKFIVTTVTVVPSLTGGMPKISLTVSAPCQKL